MQRFILISFAVFILLITACNPTDGGADDDGPLLPSFDRKAMLQTWAEDVIVPAYAASVGATGQLTVSAAGFTTSPTQDQLEALRNDFRSAYLAWQSLSPFLMGRAEELNLRFRANTYPANTELIIDNITASDLNLNLPSQNAAQGFPALDYLLHANEDQLLAAGPEADARRQYLVTLTTTLRDLIASAGSEWTDAFATAYAFNDGNSATSSVDRTVNDYIFHFEKFLRAGKVGIPAGVFSDMPLADRAEALYSGQSKALMLAALSASETFFNDHGLADYLDALNVMRDGEPLSSRITNQFAAVNTAAEGLDNSFSVQVTNDNVKMLALYDEMQRLVVLLKVDMLQALSINVDYVDADGD